MDNSSITTATAASQLDAESEPLPPSILEDSFKKSTITTEAGTASTPTTATVTATTMKREPPSGTQQKQSAVAQMAASGGAVTPQQLALAAAAVSALQGAQSTSAVTAANFPQCHLGGMSGVAAAAVSSGSRFQQLTAMIDELGKDIRPTYNANRNCQERLKRGIVQARLMVRECMAELEKSRQQQLTSSQSQQ